jgi:hypothetical protein
VLAESDAAGLDEAVRASGYNFSTEDEDRFLAHREALAEEGGDGDDDDDDDDSQEEEEEEEEGDQGGVDEAAEGCGGPEHDEDGEASPSEEAC